MTRKKIYIFLVLNIFSLASAQIPTRTEHYETYSPPPIPSSEGSGEMIYSSDKTKKGLKIKNKVVLEPVYDEIKILHNYPKNIIEVKKGNKLGIFDLNGENLIPIEFSEIRNEGLNIFVVKKEKNISVFDLEKKKTIFSGNYSKLISYNQNSALVEDISGNQFIVFNDGKKIKNDFESVDIYQNIIVVKKNNKYGILTSKQSPSYEFEKLFIPNLKGSKLGNSTKYSMAIKDFVAVKNNFYGLVDISGKTKLPIEHTNITTDERIEGFRIEKDKKIGQYFNENKILKAEYHTIYRDAFSDYLTLGKDGKYGVVDYATLKVIVPLISEEHIIRMHNGYKIKQNQKYGWYDREGNQVLAPTYDQIGEYYDSEHLLGIQKQNKKGIFDIRKKQVLVPAEFNEITDYYSGFLVGITENEVDRRIISREFTLMDMNGKKLLDTKFSSLEKSPQKKSKIIFAKKNERYSILSSKGTVSLDNISDYNYIYDQNNLIKPNPQNYNALLSLKNAQNKFAIYDEILEKLKSDFVYDDIKQKFENENTYIIVSKNKKFGVIDQDNKVIVNFLYDDLSFNLLNDYKINSQTVIAKKNGKYGLVDFSGKEHIPFSYTNLERISGDNLFKAKTGKNYILINSENKILNNGPFDDISQFEDGKALTFYGKKAKEIDKNGKFTIFEGDFSSHEGFKTFDDFKFEFLKMLDSKTDQEVKDYAKKIAPSPHLLHFLKQSAFKKRTEYLDYESVVNTYYQELLEFKNNKFKNQYVKEKLSEVRDYNIYNESLLTTYRDGTQDYGAPMAEKYLRNSFKLNGYWISSRFLYDR